METVPQNYPSNPRTSQEAVSPSSGTHHFPHQPAPSKSTGAASPTIMRHGQGKSLLPSGVAQLRQTVALPELQMNSATVFTDRAELCRSINCTFKAGQIVEMLFENVSSAIEKDSIRVELRGAATILDVTFNVRALSDLEETWLQTLGELQTELRTCKRQLESMTGKLHRIEKQRAVLDSFADSLTTPTESSEEIDKFAASGQFAQMVATQEKRSGKKGEQDCGHGSAVLSKQCSSEFGSRTLNAYDPSYMDTVQRFLSVYEEQAERLDSTLLASREEVDRTSDRIRHLEREIEEVQKRKDDNLVRELSVLIEPREDGPVEILITYVVTRCFWKAAYDIRLFNSDGSMKIIYYGMVQQTTGEDWEPKHLTLSTAQPSCGGLVPSLGMQRLYYKQHSPQPASSFVSSNKNRPPRSASTLRKSARPTGSTMVDVTSPEATRRLAAELGTVHRSMSSIDSQQHTSTLRGSSINRHTYRQNSGTSLLSNAVAEVDLNAPIEVVPVVKPPANPPPATVIFEVPRPPAIVPCTNEEVRVTVGLIDIQPEYSYVTIPKRSLSTFLKAVARNTSSFFILPGQTNIYTDNTFIGKSEIDSVAPGEDFSCDLGAETGIEVIYRPLFKSKETGLGSSHKTSINFKQLIVVRNTIPRAVKVTVVDQLPASGEEKIKVTLLEPTIKHPEKYDKSKPIRMNRNNNIEWDIDLQAGESKELALRFTVDYPAVEELTVRVDGPQANTNN